VRINAKLVTRTVLAVVVLTTLALGGAAAWFSHEGYRLYVVKTGSMLPTYAAGDVVVDRPVAGTLTRGDVITFQISAAGDLVTHRYTHSDRDGRVHTKGDNNSTADAWALRADQVRGVVERHVPNLGYLVVFLRQPAGIGGVMTSALSVVLLWGLCFPAQTGAATVPEQMRPRRRLAVAA
jgi:signal peptidase